MYQPKLFRFAFQPLCATSNFTRPIKTLFLLGLFAVVLGAGSSVNAAATIRTDSLAYEPGSTVGIIGTSFMAGENVNLVVTYIDGTPLAPEVQSSWTVVASGTGTIETGGTSGYSGLDGGEFKGFSTFWTMFTGAAPGDSLLLTATGGTSGYVATTTLLCPSSNFDQLQNGTPTNPSWANGNINQNNSCYTEGNSVPFRFFVQSLSSNSTHTFQISFAATNGGKHAYDYLTQYNLSESGAIITVGGECSSVSQAAPGDCATPVAVVALRDPRLSANYNSTPGPELSGILNLSFPIDGPGSLFAYNATNVTISKFTIGGTVSNRTLTATVTFKTLHSGSAGFFWGGHMAEGVTPGWGVNMGAGSITGSSWHMDAGKVDGSGGMVGRSVQKGTICVAPTVTLSCSAGPYCTNTTQTCSATAGAGTYFWTITGGTLLTGQGTNSITYKITALAGSPVTVAVNASNNNGGCAGSTCSTDASTQFTAEDCCTVAITCPPTATVACNQSINPSNTGTATFTTTGSCPLPITVSYTDTETAGACPQAKTVSRLWKATDANGQVRAQCTQTINVIDNVAPVLSSAPANVTVECSSIPAPATLTATDNCDPSPTVAMTQTTTPGSCAQRYTLTRTWTATDHCGNASSRSQVITVQDTQAPTITCPQTVTVQCASLVPAPNTALVVVSDNCDPAPVVAFVSDVSNNLTCPETITRTYRATDACGNSATCTQQIVVHDTTAPVVTCPAPVSVQCLADVPAPNLALVSVTDNCDPNPVKAWVSDQLGTTTCPKTITRTYKATDACGNIGSCTQTITIDDTTPPAITCPANTSVLCGQSSDPAHTGYATATDNCTPTGSIVITYADVANGVITRTWTATDACGNQSTCVQTINTPPDTAPPVITSCAAPVTVDCFADVPAPNPALVVATDACDPNPVTTFVNDVQTGSSCPYTVTRTYRVTDASGNSSTCTQTITIDDNTPPVLVGTPANVTVSCDAIPAPATVTATDNCAGVTVNYDQSDTPGACAQAKTITRTWTATDFCGNQTAYSQTITVVDNTAPVITSSPGAVSVQCVANIPVPNTTLVTATDNCDPAPVISFVSDVSNGLTCPETFTRTYKALDACGNVSFCTQTITVHDTTPPTISGPAPVSVQCLTAVPTPNPALCSASDNCDPTPTITFVSDVPNGSGCPITITRTYNATDDCGNSVTCTQTITVHDQTAPQITDPAPVSVQCMGEVPQPNPTLCTATDNCDPTPTVTFVSDVPNGSGCPMTITRTYKATDDCGNEATCTQTITVNDQTPPQITCPAPVSVQCLSQVPTPNPALCVATDNCDPNPTVAFVSDVPNGTGCPMTITRTYKATDDCGNEATCTQTITVNDQTPPQVTCPAPISVQCASLVPAPNTALCMATDNCDPNPVIAFVSDVSNGLSCPETITRTYKATDDCGNVATSTQTITIHDLTAPQLTCPAPVTVQCMSAVPQPNPTLCTATDNCDPTPTVTFVSDVPNGSGCPLTITRTYKATDDCGNETFCTQTITVNDQTPPQISCPGPLAFSCVGDVPQANPALCTATDNCDPNPVVVWVSDVPLGSCPMTITRTYKATDNCGNQATCQQIITVHDQTPPQMVGCPANVTVECNNIPAPANVTATDNCSGVTVAMVETTIPGACAQFYTITRTWTATDGCNNHASCQQTITVHDTTPPQVTCPDAITVNCLGEVPSPNTALVIANDNCDPNPTITFVSDVREGTGCPMYVARTYRAVDACGNAATCTQMITIDDRLAPQLSGCPQNVTVSCGQIPPVATVTATDNCDGTVSVTLNEVTTPGSCTYNYTVTRTWTASDICGNQAQCQQVITVRDDTDPEMTCPAPLTVQCIGEVPQPNPASVTVSDNCDPHPVVSFVSDVRGPQSCSTLIMRTYRAVDACGNEATCTQMITLNDETPPVFTTFPTDQNLSQCQPTQICLPVVASDNCLGSVVYSVTAGQGAIANGQWCFTPTASTSFAVTVRAADTCGNFVERTFNLAVQVNRVPSFTNCPTNAQVHWGQTYTVDLDATDLDAGQTLTYSLCPSAPAGASINPTTGVLTFAATAHDICDPSLCVIVKDNCNSADTCSFDICVTNDPPVITCPESQTLCYGYPLETQVTATDPDHGPYQFFHLVNGPAGLQVNATTGQVTWPNPVPGSYQVCVTVTDSAAVCSPCSPSNSDTCCFAVNIVSLDLVIEKLHDQIQGQYTDVSIDFKNQGTNWPIAGFDLLIQYDGTALSFQMATEGKFFTDCAWEYFTYRFGANGNCGGGACPSGIVRIVGMAETSGGNMANHPDCYSNDGIPNPGPGSTTSTEMANLRFLVSDNRTLECQYVPIRFVWYDCGDNALSNVRGDTMYVSHFVYDYAGETGLPPVVQWNDITGLDNDMPTFTGAPSPQCDTRFKFWPVRCANFYNGGVDIICADSIDAPGDINLNNVAYEIADAVMLTNYFTIGMSAFEGHIEGSIAASDVNRDGLTLSVADLVLLIRVVVGDCLPYAKEMPMAPVAAGYSVDDGVVAVSTDVDISGAALVVRGNVAPELLATGMDMAYAYDGTVTRIVVTPPVNATSMHSFRGAFIKGIYGDIVSLELATAQGVPVTARNVPARYSLSQNYPNPFNPMTTVEFALPAAGDYRLTIYNIEGRQVDVFEGRADAPGVFRIDWNAVDRASGVYLYRLDAGKFSQTRKMLLLK